MILQPVDLCGVAMETALLMIQATTANVTKGMPICLVTPRMLVLNNVSCYFLASLCFNICQLYA